MKTIKIGFDTQFNVVIHFKKGSKNVRDFFLTVFK